MNKKNNLETFQKKNFDPEDKKKKFSQEKPVFLFLFKTVRQSKKQQRSLETVYFVIFLNEIESEINFSFAHNCFV
jgi:hypothetical protein